MHYQKTQLTFMSDSIIVASNHTNYKSIAGCVSQQNHVIVNKFFFMFNPFLQCTNNNNVIKTVI